MIGLESILLLSSAAILGVFVGAQIAEACLFVPVWKEMDPDDFFEQHQYVGPLIYRFFAPLTIAATVVPLATVGIGLILNSQPNIVIWIMGASTLAFFSTYFLYFKAANQKFADRTLSNDELPVELHRWGQWHWTRVGLETIAFGCSIILLLYK
ncbi:MAG: DUF1772 domain-containing protein [Rhodothermaceae bacterium]|nr:DUF1772 domain-containing protein [Rhodothermaceae bacterium]